MKHEPTDLQAVNNSEFTLTDKALLKQLSEITALHKKISKFAADKDKALTKMATAADKKLNKFLDKLKKHAVNKKQFTANSVALYGLEIHPMKKSYRLSRG